MGRDVLDFSGEVAGPAQIDELFGFVQCLAGIEELRGKLAAAGKWNGADLGGGDRAVLVGFLEGEQLGDFVVQMFALGDFFEVGGGHRQGPGRRWVFLLGFLELVDRLSVVVIEWLEHVLLDLRECIRDLSGPRSSASLTASSARTSSNDLRIGGVSSGWPANRSVGRSDFAGYSFL